MGVSIYLSINNNEEVLQIPVTPPEIEIKSSQGTQTFETSGYGFIRIIGSRELTSISWKSIFPVRDYPFRKDYSLNGREYADKLNNWRDRRLPIRLVITSSGFADISVNIACVISELNTTVGSGGDTEYSIQLDEVDLLSTTLGDEEVLTMAQYEELTARLSAIEERLTAVENVMIYNYMDDNMPSWAKPSIQKIMDKGYISGVADNELGLTMEMIRMIVILDNAGCFD